MTATTKQPTPASAPGLVVRMPLHGLPARLVSMFGLLVSEYGGDAPLDAQPEDVLFTALLRKRLVKKEITPEALVGAYLHSIGTMQTPSRSVTVSMDGGVTEFKLQRPGCTITLELRNHGAKPLEVALRFEGRAKALAALKGAKGDLGNTLGKRLWTGANGARSANFADALQFWFLQAVQFEADQKLG